MKESSRMCAATRECSPCKGCSERFTACHDRCPKDERGKFGYKAWKTLNEDMKQKTKEYREKSKEWEKTII